MSGFDNEVLYCSGVRLEQSDAQSISLMQRTATDVSNINHTGDPEGVVSANPASLSHDPVSGVIYQKTSGTGNTGWQAIGGGGGSSSYFQAYLTSPVNVAPNDATFTIVFDTPIVNVGSNYNASNGKFTAPATGFYAFSCCVYFNNLNLVGPTSILVAYTGSAQSLRLIQEGYQATVTGNAIIFTPSWSMPMTAGDTVQIQPYTDGAVGNYQIYGAPLSSSAFNTASVFSGFRVA